MVQLLVLGLIAGVGPSNVFASASVVPDFGADFQPAQGPNMNGDFVLSTTPGGKEGLFPKTYTDFPGGVEAYDVLSPPITTLYSQVWWAPLAPVSFPEEMIAKYTNKTVAIVGWEIDQVRVLPDGTEHSVPISATYNHHYNLQIIGAAAQFKKIWLNGPHDPRAKELLRASHGMVAYDQPHYVPEIVGDTSRGPASAFVTSGNGGEYRKTFHGFAPGHAVVIDSPTQIQLSPMQIDTWNRDEMDISQPLPPKFVAGPLPRSSEAPVNASYSGLLECPMTTRLTKVVDGAYVVEGAGGVCAAPILTFQECFHAAASTLGNEGTPASQFKNTTGSAPQRPSGCSVSSSIDSGSGSNHIQVYFNELSNSTVGCAADAGIVSGAASSLVDVAVTLNATSKLATISLTGPSDVWFGVGFGAQAMADRPWTIVVDGNGNVSERHLGGESPNSHIAGDPLQPSVTVVGSSVASTLRTVVLTRPFQGAGPDYYTFNASASNMVLPFINAIGSGPDLAYHKDKAPAKLPLLPRSPAAGACLCPEAPAPFGMATGQLVYHATNQSGDVGSGSVAFGQQKCKPFPTTVLNEQRNPTCDIRYYQGGQWACHHMWSLLDADQEIPWADQPLVFHHKWRVYVQPYNATYHKSLYYDYADTMVIGSPYEYDVPDCAAGVQPGTTTSTVPGCSLGGPDNRTWIHTITGNKIGGAGKMASLNFHCHAPTCLSMSVYACEKGTPLEICNATVGKLLCEERPVYGGTGAAQLNGTRFDEDGYIAIPDCLWGDEAFGLEPAPDLDGVPLHMVKTANATWPHYGEMAGGQPFSF